jgi:hypothetical protein
MFFQYPHPDTRPYAVDRDLALSIVGDLESIDAASLTPEDLRCCICYSNYDDGSPVDDSPIKTPCCRQMFGRNCLVEALMKECHCPMYRACYVAEHQHNVDPDSD